MLQCKKERRSVLEEDLGICAIAMGKGGGGFRKSSTQTLAVDGKRDSNDDEQRPRVRIKIASVW